MANNKGKIIFWGTILLILLMIAAIFIPMSIMRGTMADTVEQLNERYDEDFTMTWSNIDERPLSDTFTAIMQSNKTGITYDATITDGEAVIDYESETKNGVINSFVEQAIPNTIVFAKLNDEKLSMHLLTADTLTEDQLAAVASQLKAEFQLTNISMDTFIITEESYEMAKEHFSSYYQRSTLPAEAFDNLKPTVSQFEF